MDQVTISCHCCCAQACARCGTKRCTILGEKVHPGRYTLRSFSVSSTLRLRCRIAPGRFTRLGTIAPIQYRSDDHFSRRVWLLRERRRLHAGFHRMHPAMREIQGLRYVESCAMPLVETSHASIGSCS